MSLLLDSTFDPPSWLAYWKKNAVRTFAIHFNFYFIFLDHVIIEKIFLHFYLTVNISRDANLIFEWRILKFLVRYSKNIKSTSDAYLSWRKIISICDPKLCWLVRNDLSNLKTQKVCMKNFLFVILTLKIDFESEILARSMHFLDQCNLGFILKWFYQIQSTRWNIYYEWKCFRENFSQD